MFCVFYSAGQSWLAAALGQVLKHDDSVNDRGEGSQLATGWQNTQKAWSELRLPGESSISKPGGMWRGNPSMEQVLAIKNLQQIAQGVDGTGSAISLNRVKTHGV